MSINVNQIDAYMSALIENSRELINESEILFKAEAYARSYTLAHIAREELAKCKILYAAGRRLISGVDVDWKITMRRLRDHKSKLRQETISNSVLALLVGDEDAFEKILNGADISSVHRNNNKNDSLYVGIDNEGKIRCPMGVVARDLAENTLKLAKYALDEEIKFQKTVGVLTKMNTETMPDITALDQLGFDDKKKLMKALAHAIGSTRNEIQ